MPSKKIKKLNAIIDNAILEALGAAGGGLGGTQSYSSATGLDFFEDDEEIIDIGFVPAGRIISEEGISLNDTLLAAWRWLSPLLPAGARLTSGVRTQAEQDRIIRDYASENGIDYTNLDQAHRQLRRRGFVIARRISTTPGVGHGGGGAFDVSGAPLQQIKQAVETATEDPNIRVEFAPFRIGARNRSIVEPRNNAVHVEVRSAEPATDAEIMAAVAPYTGRGGQSALASAESPTRDTEEEVSVDV